MCEANAYLWISETEAPELIMESVDTIEPVDQGLKLTSIFGDQKYIDAQVHSLSLVDHKVYLRKS